MKYPIKLGRSMGEKTSDMPMKDGKFYPSLFLEWDDDYELPELGTMTIKFRKVSETTSSRPGDKERQSVTLDILEIVDTKAGKVSDKEKKEESGEEALDRHMEESKKKDSEEYD